jgi:hypothetical protein
VLAVDEIPLFAAEVDAIADAISEVSPEFTRTHLRRLALTNVVLERLACRSRHASARERARIECANMRDLLPGGDEALPEGLPVVPLAGRFGQLDLDLWCTARRLEVGAWSQPIELVGRWVLIRVRSVERDGDGDGEVSPAEVSYELEVLRFPYVGSAENYFLDTEASVRRAVDASVLTFVEPSWVEMVPEEWQRRMRAER